MQDKYKHYFDTKYRIEKIETCFTMVYYHIKENLNIDFEEYMILDYMVHFSTKNTFNKTIVNLSNRLNLSRGTCYNRIKKLSSKGHITKDNTTEKYYLHYDIEGEMKNISDDDKFIIIYHQWKELNVKSLNHYLFIYFVFSHSNNEDKIATFGKKYICNYLGIKNRNFHSIIETLEDKDILRKAFGKNEYSLSDDVVSWIENKRDKDKVIIHWKKPKKMNQETYEKLKKRHNFPDFLDDIFWFNKIASQLEN